jgi:hypothetical protein
VRERRTRTSTAVVAHLLFGSIRVEEVMAVDPPRTRDRRLDAASPGRAARQMCPRLADPQLHDRASPRHRRRLDRGMTRPPRRRWLCQQEPAVRRPDGRRATLPVDRARGEAPMMAGPGDEVAAGAGRPRHLRISHTDRRRRPGRRGRCRLVRGHAGDRAPDVPVLGGEALRRAAFAGGAAERGRRDIPAPCPARTAPSAPRDPWHTAEAAVKARPSRPRVTRAVIWGFAGFSGRWSGPPYAAAGPHPVPPRRIPNE